MWCTRAPPLNSHNKRKTEGQNFKCQLAICSFNWTDRIYIYMTVTLVSNCCGCLIFADMNTGFCAISSKMYSYALCVATIKPLNEWVWVTRGCKAPVQHSRETLSAANCSWKWLSTPAGCCSCGCDTESTQNGGGSKVSTSPPEPLHTYTHKWRGRVAAHTPMWINTHTHTAECDLR